MAIIATIKNLENSFSISKAAAIIGFFTLISRLVGLVRDRMFASKFGAGDVLDVYYAAFRIPDFIFNLLVLGTLSAAFVPVFTEWLIKDKARAWRIANTVLNASILIMGLLCLVLLLFVEPLTKLLVPGFSPDKLQATATLTRIFLASPIIFTVSNFFSSILSAQKKFLMASLAPVLYNVGIILGLVYLYPAFGLKGLGLGVVAGAAMHLLLQLFESLKNGFYWLPVLDLKDQAVVKIGKLFVPRIFGLDTSQISLLAASVIGSFLSPGSIAVLNLANNLQAVPLGIFAISTVIASFPSLSEKYAKKDEAGFLETLQEGMQKILFFIIPITVLILLFRAYIVRLAYGAGEFNWNDTILTFDTLGIMAFSLFSQSLTPLFARSFYARQDTKTPVAVGIFFMAFNIAISYALAMKLGVKGIAIGFSSSSILGSLTLFLILKTRLSALSRQAMDKFDTELSSSVLSIIIASLVMGMVGYSAIYAIAPLVDTETGLGILTQSASAALLAVSAFFFTALKLKIPQAMGIAGKLKELAARL